MDGNRIDEMISYMNRKYNDSFSYVSTIGQRFGSDIFRIVCSSEKYHDEPVYVTWQKTNNDVLISDNYIGIKFKKATIDLLNQKISSEFGDDFYIQYEVFGSPVYPEYDDNTNLNTFLTDKRSGLSFNALVYCDSKVFDKDSFESRIINAFVSGDICISGSLYFTNTKTDISNVSSTREFGLYKHECTYINSCIFIMKSNTELFLFKWEK